MADSSNGKELSMEMRLLLAFILMGAVLFLTQYFYTPATPPQRPVEQAQSQQPTAQEPEATPEPPKEEAPAPPPAEVPGASAAAGEQEDTIDTDVYKVTFSNKGAVVKSWILKEYEDGAGGPLELVNGADHLGDDSLPQAAKDSVQAMREQVGYPFSLDFAGDQAPAFDPNSQVSAATET
ncbi:MAG: membrane protein insertase YidC, partial [bacterium]|nr:membrane protein insertase YidC [bacterium]